MEVIPKGSWRRFSTSEFPAIDWTFGPSPQIVCNGITIGKDGASAVPQGPTVMDFGPFLRPKISLWDPNGRLPLNLQRTEVAGEWPFQEDLLTEICRDFLAFLLLTVPVTSQSAFAHRAFRRMKDYRGLGDRSMIPAFGEYGMTMFMNWHLTALGSPHCLLIPETADSGDSSETPPFNLGQTLVVPVNSDAEFPIDGGTSQRWGSMKIRGARRLYIERSRGLGGSNRGHWTVANYGEMDSDDAMLRSASAFLSGRENEWLGEIGPVTRPDKRLTRFETVWKDTLGAPILPFDLDARIKAVQAQIQPLSGSLVGFIEEGVGKGRVAEAFRSIL